VVVLRDIGIPSGLFGFEFDMVVHTKTHSGIIAVGIFLFFGAAMALLAGTTLIWRGAVLDGERNCAYTAACLQEC
jgi:hypothetical protein